MSRPAIACGAIFHILRPMATITDDTLDWYGFDEDGGGLHDVIGTRCDPYTNFVLNGVAYDHCCHSNLSRGLGAYLGKSPREVEQHVHDVLNVFMCSGFQARHAPILPQGKPGAAGRLSRILRRDRPSRRALGVPRRRLRIDAIRATLRNAIPCLSRSIGRHQAHWPDGGRRRATAIPGRMARHSPCADINDATPAGVCYSSHG